MIRKYIYLVLLITTLPINAAGAVLCIESKPICDKIEKANQGNADAQFNLGLMYEYGKGVRQSLADAKNILD